MHERTARLPNVQVIRDLLHKSGIRAELDSARALDHGTWVVMSMLYPDAGIPFVQMSVNPHLSNIEQYQIGRALAVLKSEGYLIIGSGATVHNLRALDWSAARQNVCIRRIDTARSACPVGGSTEQRCQLCGSAMSLFRKVFLMDGILRRRLIPYYGSK